MSTLKTKKVQLGDNADPSKNFLIEVPAVADGTLSIKRQDGTNVLSIDATGKAVIPGVVGTVAQVGGVPTGQVVERGSNANGEYVRFADGTQICSLPSGLQTSTAQHILWTFPAEFSENKYTGASMVGLTSATCIAPVFADRLPTSVKVAAITSANARSYQTLFPFMVGRWF